MTCLTVLSSTLLAGVTLGLSTPEPNLLPGEPVKVVVTWGASSAVSRVLIEEPEFEHTTLEFVVDDGHGPKRYCEYPHERGDRVVVGGDIRPGDRYVVNYVLLGGDYEEPGAACGTRPPATVGTAPIFPTPGRYSLKAAYVHRRGQSIQALSNEVVFSVGEPPDDEAAVLQVLQRDPKLAKGWVPTARLRDLIRAHPASRYLRWLKTQLFEGLAGELRNNTDPETGESWWRLSKEEANERARAAAEKITQEIALDGDWGPFEEERLWALARWARSAHDMALSSWARDQIKQRFPDSMAAAGVKEWEDTLRQAAARDAEPIDGGLPDDGVSPVLLADAHPSYLWPANNKLVPIRVSVDVTDEDDPDPKVRLISITCTPSCDYKRDVVGAEYGTDDREFQLRASLSPAPKGKRGHHHKHAERTYTITYSAEDDEGHKTKAETAVVVAQRPPFTHVRPFVNCVAETGPHAYRAFFGYVNTSPQAIEIPVGWKNAFFPPPKDRNQPRVFLPGRHEKVLSLEFVGRPPLAWRLGAGWAMAHRRSQKCQ